MITKPVSSIKPREVTDSWRQLEEIKGRYREAAAQYKKLLKEADGRPSYATVAFESARKAEFQALVEYIRRLRIFTELTISAICRTRD